MNNLFGGKGSLQYLIIGTIAAAVAWYLYTKFNEYNQILLMLKTEHDALRSEVVQVRKTIWAYNMANANGHLEYDSNSSVHERSHSTMSDESIYADSDDEENEDNKNNLENIQDECPVVGSACVDSIPKEEESNGGLSGLWNSATNKLNSALKKEKIERSVVIDLESDDEKIEIEETIQIEEPAKQEEPEKSGSESESEPDSGSESEKTKSEDGKKKRKDKKNMIKNPETGRMVSIDSKLGKKILKSQKKKK